MLCKQQDYLRWSVAQVGLEVQLDLLHLLADVAELAPELLEPGPAELLRVGAPPLAEPPAVVGVEVAVQHAVGRRGARGGWLQRLKSRCIRYKSTISLGIRFVLTRSFSD